MIVFISAGDGRHRMANGMRCRQRTHDSRTCALFMMKH